MSVMQKIKDIEDEVYHPVSTIQCLQSWIFAVPQISSCPPRFNLAYAARSQTGLEAHAQGRLVLQMARTQKNKATSAHLGSLKVRYGLANRRVNRPPKVRQSASP